MKQFKMLRNKQIYNLQQLRVHWYSEKETNIQLATTKSTLVFLERNKYTIYNIKINCKN